MPDPSDIPNVTVAAPARPTLEELGWDHRVAALAEAAEHAADAVVGRVVAMTRNSCQVVTRIGEGRAAAPPLRGGGDGVLVNRPDPSGPLTVVETLPRWSALERHAAARATEVQVLAVNIDL